MLGEFRIGRIILKLVGKSVPGVDAAEKLTGGYSYPVEIRISGMLHGKILRSPYTHARIRRIDTSKAERHPQVKAVVTAKDFPRIYYHPKIGVDPDSSSLVRDSLVMEDEVRYVGDEVAAVAASSEDAALEALDLIDVDYEELPALMDFEKAIKEDAQKVHPPAGNVAKSVSSGWGNIDDSLKEAELVFTGTYSTQRVSQFPLEPHVCVCDIDHNANLTVHSSTQMIHGLKERMSKVLQHPFSKIRVVKPRYIGGAFGAKLDMNPVEPICAMLCLKAKEPVRIRLTREEEILTTAFMPTVQTLKTGVSRNGTLTARYCSLLVDGGAHSSHAPSIVNVAAAAFLASYKTPHVRFEGSTVYTHNPPAGAYRGYGGPQGLFGLEQQMDEIAHELRLDPLELRLRNVWKEGDPNPRLGGASLLTSYAFEDCLRRGAEAFGWRGLVSPPANPSGISRGFGLACIPMGGSGITGKKGGSIEASGAILRLDADGTVNLTISTIDQGGGQNTVLSQIAAEVLGAKLQDIHLSRADTDVSPLDAPTHATRVTYVVGSVVRNAADELKTRILRVASEELDAVPDALEIENSMVYVKDAPSRIISFEQIAHRAIFSAPGHPPIGVSSEIPQSNPSPSGAHFAEVEIDTETGGVRVVNYVAAHDVGTAINPLGVEGQVCGGIAQGLGYALTEHLHFDTYGTPHGTDLADYKILGSGDLPPIRVVTVEKTDVTGPMGAKGVSEPAIIPVAPAIANAIHNAIGVRVKNLPITPEQIVLGLSKKR